MPSTNPANVGIVRDVTYRHIDDRDLLADVYVAKDGPAVRLEKD
jgi:hypothetical protein